MKPSGVSSPPPSCSSWPRRRRSAAGLPDLGGRTVVAVTENAYTPLNFADPKTGQGHRLGVRRLQRDRQAPQRQGRLEAVELGHDDPGRPRRPVRRRHGRHHHHRRAQEAGRLLRPLHGLAAVHAGARRREPLHRRQDASPPTRTCWSAPRPARPISIPPSTTSSTATRTIRASSCSTPSAPRCRR